MAKVRIEAPGGLQHQQCHFPVSSRVPRLETLMYSDCHVEVPTALEFWQSDDTRLRRLLGGCWAILLRSYVRNDFVSFRDIAHTALLKNCHHSSRKSFVHDEPRCPVYQYQIFEDQGVDELSASEILSCNHIDIQDRLINTAVCLEPSSSQDKQDNEETCGMLSGCQLVKNENVSRGYSLLL